MRKLYQIVGQRLVEGDDAQSAIVAYCAPTDAERRYMIDELNVDEHTFNSALDPDELSRLEFEPEHLAVIYKRPKNFSQGEQMMFQVASTGVFLFKDRLWVVVKDEGNSLFDGVQGRMRSLPTVVLKLLTSALVHFREHLRAIQRVSEELQGEINRAMENKHLISMFALQKSLVYYVNAIGSNGALLDRLKHNVAKIGFTIEETELLDDLIIENQQCFRQAEMYSNILASLMDARASIVANNLNKLMKNLSVIAISIMAPTLIVSMFSMNIPLPWGLRDIPYAFWLVIAAALSSAAAFLYLWKHRGG